MVTRLCVLALCALAGAAVPTGIEAGLSQTTFDNFKNTMLPQLLAELSTISLPDYSQVLGSGFFKVSVYVTKVHGTGFNLDIANTGVTLVGPNSATIQASGLTGQMTFTWAYESPLGGDSGEGAVQIQDTSMSATLVLGQTNGAPHMTVSAMSFKISDISITISNSPIANVANWLLSVLKDNFISDLTAALNQYGPATLTGVIGEVLGEYSTQAQITETLAINYQLTQDPVVVSSSYVQLSVMGQFIDLTHPDQVMLVSPPPTLPGFNPASKEIQLYVTDYSLNTGLYAGMTSGAFTGEITQQTPTIGAMLTTSILEATFPGLVAKYGSGLPCAFSCAAVAPAPYFVLTQGNPGSITGNIVMECDLLVQDARAVSLSITTSFNTEASLEKWVLNLTLTNSEVGSVQVIYCQLDQEPSGQELTDFLNILVQGVLPSAFLSIFGQGIALPTYQGVDLSDATLTILDRYLSIQATPVFTFGEEVQSLKGR
jgi:hypothetical protein